MKITLEKLKSERKISGCYEDIEIFGNSGYRIKEPIEICYIMQLAGDRVEVSLKITGALILDCDRCISDFTHEIVIDHRFEFPIADFGEEFDISEEARQQCFLSIPLKKLCNEYCKGLCTICGIDFNKERCQCSLEKPDSRFEELKKLKF